MRATVLFATDGSDIGTDNPAELLPGTLDLLVLRTLVRQANHGYGIEQYRAR
jgi:hypothetical protein